MPTGLFITFEGVDGAGKSTQTALLKGALEAAGYTVCATREPGGDTFAEAVRQLLLSTDMVPQAELLLFLAARAQHVHRIVRPNLESGEIVLCDRYMDSTLAYQGFARRLDLGHIRQLNAFATGGLVPDLTLLLDLDPAAGLGRQGERNRMESEGLAFHQRVRQGFLHLAANEPARFAVVDAAAPPDAIHDVVLQRVLAVLDAKR